MKSRESLALNGFAGAASHLVHSRDNITLATTSFPSPATL
jgi:glyoxylase-like metal-dependent hydrolase (beta-lactamase superfamily II)